MTAPCYIYCVRNPGTGNVKIGSSCDVASRLVVLQTGCEHDLQLVGVFPGRRSTEMWIHRLLEGRRLKGEWFTDEDRAVSEWFLLTSKLRSTIEPREDEPIGLLSTNQQFKIRVPPQILEEIAALADLNFRSVGAEITYRLVNSLK